MRILHVLDHSIPLHSGYTFRTRAILREQRKKGWETFQLTSPKQLGCDADEETVDGLHFYRTPTMPAGTRWPGIDEWALMRRLRIRLEQVARAVRPDVIHAHSPVLNAAPALTVGARLGIPVVYEVRAFWEDAAVDHGSTTEGSLRYRLTRAFETRALKRAAHVFTICEGLKGDIVSRGVPSAQVTVVPNAVDIEAFEPGGAPDPSLIQALGFSGSAVIGFIGSFYAYEGLDLLLDAMPALLKMQPNTKVLLVGGGPHEDVLKSRATALGLGDHVVFAGRVPHAEVGRYYDLLDVLVYPRRAMRLTELVTPLKPLEAMAQGRIVLASDVGGHKELIRDGVTGHLFVAGRAEELASKLSVVLAERDRWPAMRSAGRRFVESERNWSASVSRYAAAYDAALRGSRAIERARA